LLTPAIKRLFRNLHLPDRIDPRHSLSAKHLTWVGTHGDQAATWLVSRNSVKWV
jgi:hypothetical protein